MIAVFFCSFIHQTINIATICHANYGQVIGCAFETKDMDQMRRHIFIGTHKNSAGNIIEIKSTGPNNYRCCVMDCDFRCIEYDKMIQHGQAEHADIREQMSISYSDRQLTCPVCLKGFDLPITLYRHKNSKKKRSCRGCQREFYPEVYHAHLAQCTESLKCTICDKVLSSKEALKNHQLAVHFVEQSDNTRNTKQICNICGIQVYKIGDHMKGHLNKRNWRCSTCGAGFNCRTILKNHERTHSNERNFPCRQGCDKRYKSPGDRDRHEKSVHLGIKPFKCALCSETFVRDRDLRLHQRKHTGLKLHPCSLCNASFDKHSELKEHYKARHNEND